MGQHHVPIETVAQDASEVCPEDPLPPIGALRLSPPWPLVEITDG